jgi:starvation-inducible outer membrane lipoprotein
MSRLTKFVVIRIYIEHEMKISQKDAKFLVIKAMEHIVWNIRQSYSQMFPFS